MKLCICLGALLVLLLQIQDSTAKPKPIFIDFLYRIFNMGPASGSYLYGSGQGTGFYYNANTNGFQGVYGYRGGTQYYPYWGYRRRW